MLAQLIEAIPLLCRLIPGLYELLFFLTESDPKITAQVRAQLKSSLDELDEAIERLRNS